MKKNPFLTFIFACVPGAGQMYYGYMLRGLSMITLFCIGFCLGMLAGPMVVVCGIVWMYSFFDTYDLIRYLVAGEPKADGLLLVGDVERFKELVPQHNKLLGWGLVGIGVWALYANLIEPVLYKLFAKVFGEGNAWYILDNIPTLVVAVLFVLAGLWLLGLHPSKKVEDLPYYTPPAEATRPEETSPEAAADPEENAALAKLRAELDAGVPVAPEVPFTGHEVENN